MVIKKLNKFFHNHSRIIFGIFAVLIILAFSELPMGGCDNVKSNSVGTVFGENVTAGDVQDLSNDYALFMQCTGRQLADADMRDVQSILNLKALMMRAEQLGITVSEAEIADMIKKNPQFADGKFSQKKLDEFLAQNGMTMEMLANELKRQYGNQLSDDQISDVIKQLPLATDGKFSQAKYDEFLKENNLNDDNIIAVIRKFAVVEKVMDVIKNSVVVSDEEVKKFYELSNPGFEFEVCSIKAADPKTAKYSEKELKEFYEKNKSRFMTQPMFQTVGALVPYTGFTAKAEKEITAEMVNKAKLFHPGKSDADVKKVLVSQRAQIMASADASRYSREVFELLNSNMGIDEQLKVFREWAADKGMEIQESKDTSYASYSPISAAAMKVPAKGIQLFNGAIPVEKGVLILMMKKRIEPTAMTFAAVREQIVKLYPAEKLNEEVASKVAEINKKQGNEKVKAFKALKGTFQTVKWPAEMAEMMKNQMLYQLVMQAQIQQPDEISAPLPTENGVAVVRMVKRLPADMKTFETQQDAIRNQLVQSKQQSAMIEFFDEIRRQCQVVVPDGVEQSEGEKQAE